MDEDTSMDLASAEDTAVVTNVPNVMEEGNVKKRKKEKKEGSDKNKKQKTEGNDKNKNEQGTIVPSPSAAVKEDQPGQVVVKNKDHDSGQEYDSSLSDLLLEVLNDPKKNTDDTKTKEEHKALSIQMAKHYATIQKKKNQKTPELRIESAMGRFFYLSDSLQNKLKSVMEKYEEERKQQDHHGSSKERQASFASIAFKINDSDLTHTFDLDAFRKKVMSVHDTFYNGDNSSGYIGPYFPFVQSSGMGKTKILYEFKKQFATKEEDGYEKKAKLVLCRKQTTDDDERRNKEGAIFDTFLSLDDIVNNDKVARDKTSASDAFDKILKKLDDTFNLSHEIITSEFEQPREKSKILVLMFDEAHYLLDRVTFKDKDKDEQKKIEVFLFRAVRLWIRTKFKSTRVVAVFAGTNTKLGNFKVETDKFPNEEKNTDSRDYQNKKEQKRKFYSEGSKGFDPFFQTTTIGCLQTRLKPKPTNSDYELAIPHGRPLFALMHHDNDRLSAGLDTIIRRMLIKDDDWESKESSWISILGTRVQMGQMPIRIASKMVGSAYANLVGVDESGEETAKIAFMPDPVCARLAMCLMDEDWEMDIADKEEKVKGKSKSWWSEKVSEVFSKGLCTPDKGDVGEIMVALYFLFCADILRKEADLEYKTFSVSLECWIRLLKKDSSQKSAVPVKDKSEQDCQKEKQIPKEKITFNAIQVCRNYLRPYKNSWEELKDKFFLERLYEAGVGFYVFAGCEMIDLVFALKKTDLKGERSYFPMVVSVKSHASYSANSAKTECQKMLQRANDAGGTFFCLLVAFGSKEGNPKDGDLALSDSCVDKLICGKTVAAVLRVPANDDFGLSNAFHQCTSSKQEHSEIFASHFFLGAHHQKGNDLKAFAEAVLRSSEKKDLINETQNLHKALIQQK